MRATILSVGTELVTGQTLDTNSQHLACLLEQRGIPVVGHYTVADSEDEIAEAIIHLAERSELLVISGGLGPTEDDLTRQALARAMGSELVLNETCVSEIEEFFRARGVSMDPSNRRQAMIPAGAEPLANRRGTAPGIAAKIGKTCVFVLPGVPHEMRQMFAEQVAPRLGEGRGAIVHRAIHAFGLGESSIGSRIADLMRRHDGYTVGTTVAAAMVTVRITSSAAGTDQADSQATRIAEEIARRLGDLVVGRDDDTMASVVGELLAGSKATLAVAESCTGGMIGQMITEVPGSSRYFLGGVIAYASQVKQSLLGIPESVLHAHGAVSEPVAAGMAEGCRRQLGSTYGIGVTGIAGPTGATEAKPVGLVCMALAHQAGTLVHRHLFSGDRATIRLRAALTALNYLRLKLLGP